MEKATSGKQVAFYLKCSTIDRLNGYCRASRSSKSSLVNDILNRYFDEVDSLFSTMNMDKLKSDGKVLLLETLFDLNDKQDAILNEIKELKNDR